ncbi:PLP-dependent aminotransferase family protein [Sphingomonas sp. AR_OL41]|uniref:aminotransferase-like domain-containing protein n=1 Tax=Sphingomonas sp. AR_OL41 TaxID=3042729 RepID=UPI002480EB6A|nr:PLP-dependent aminotransferase family protein [Sphingomonas sp. AR_OL41]MDH7973351.1 PLP-dependent aminotransferase family protein [Sphingomonas sp. AR_OL41]
MTDRWLPELAQATGPKYRAIADAIAAAIDGGTLRHGDRLPAQRDVAAQLGVDLTTVTKAYDMARTRGHIAARGRAGSFVLAREVVSFSEPPAIDTAMNMPPELDGGLLGQAMIAATTALLGASATPALHYQLSGGAPQARAAGAALLTGLGMSTDDEQVIVTAGGQNALHAIVSAALSPGDVVACGRHVYPGFTALARRLGLRLVPLPAFDAAHLTIACREQRVRALYVVPTNDNPTTMTVSVDERKALAEVAARHGVIIIEDDAYGALARNPVPTFAALAPETSWHIASMSKILSPALRVAFVRAPGVSQALRLAADVHETAIMAPPLNAAIVGAWLSDGTFPRLLNAMRAEAEARQAIARAALGTATYSAHPQGYHLWLPLPAHIAAAHLAGRMLPSGLSIVPSHSFAVDERDSGNAVRVSLGGPIDRERLGRALRLLNGHITSPAERPAPMV